MISTGFIFFLLFLVFSVFFMFFLGIILIFVWFPVYLQLFLVTNLSGNDGTANPLTLPGT